MKRIIVLLIALVALIALTLTPVAAGGDNRMPQRIAFAPGAISAVRDGALAANGTDQWVLRIMGGQTLTVQLTPSYGNGFFSLMGANGAVLADSETYWSETVPANQDYYITVQADGDSALNYTLAVTAPPLPHPAPVPSRRNYDGTFENNEYIVELSQALGCIKTECPISGRLLHLTAGAPEIVDIQGTANSVNGAVQFHADLAGGPYFSGTVDANGQTLAGTLGGYGPIRLVRR